MCQEVALGGGLGPVTLPALKDCPQAPGALAWFGGPLPVPFHGFPGWGAVLMSCPLSQKRGLGAQQCLVRQWAGLRVQGQRGLSLWGCVLLCLLRGGPGTPPAPC